MRETKREQTLRKKFLSTLQKARYCHATLACRAHPAWEATEACLEASDVVGRKAGTMAQGVTWQGRDKAALPRKI